MLPVVENRKNAQHSLSSREELQQLLLELIRPIEERFSPGYARVSLGHTGARYSNAVAGMEGFARPLWGLAPFEFGSGRYGGWDRYRKGLAHGCDPKHPEYWGVPGDKDQRLVELAPIAFTLATLPHLLWEPLDPNEKKGVADYLLAANSRQYPESNWLFFRVLVNLALDRIGIGGDARIVARDLDAIEGLYRGNGWYADGPGEPCDLYNAFAFHFYSLLYCALAGESDSVRCERFKNRAAEFAQSYVNWFSPDGACVPYGRSLTYRFTHGAFWSALAFADVEALPWGVVKGLLLRNLRWWMERPIRDEAGLLTLGYAYPSLFLTEEYNSSASPYWALKAFLCLAVPDSHPIWTSEEQPLPQLPEISLQEEPMMLLQRDSESGHVVALSGGQPVPKDYRHMAEKYAKFAYSSHFGFSVPTALRGLELGAFDSCLELSEEGEYWRTRTDSFDQELFSNAVAFTWRPWPDVEVQTWLIAAGKWHVRVHRLKAQRRLVSAEGAFAVSREGADGIPPERSISVGPGAARATLPSGVSAIQDLIGGREGTVVRAAPNSNLMAARTLIPTLQGRHRPGEHWLACAVAGVPGEAKLPELPIRVETTDSGFRVTSGNATIFELG